MQDQFVIASPTLKSAPYKPVDNKTAEFERLLETEGTTKLSLSNDRLDSMMQQTPTPPQTPAKQDKFAARDDVPEDDWDLLQPKRRNDTASLAEFFRNTSPEMYNLASQKKKKAPSLLSKFMKAKKEKELQTASPPMPSLSLNNGSPDMKPLNYNDLPPEKQMARSHSLGYQKTGYNVEIGNINSQQAYQQVFGTENEDSDDSTDSDLPMTEEDELVMRNTELNARVGLAQVTNPLTKSQSSKKVTFNQTVIEVEWDWVEPAADEKLLEESEDEMQPLQLTLDQNPLMPELFELSKAPVEKQKRKVRHVQIQARLVDDSDDSQVSNLKQIILDLRNELAATKTALALEQQESLEKQSKFDSLSGQAYLKIKELLSERSMMEIENESLKNQLLSLEKRCMDWLNT